MAKKLMKKYSTSFTVREMQIKTMAPKWIWRNELKLKEGGNCKKNDLFYQSICHSLRLLKILQFTMWGDLHCLEGSFFFFQILVQLHWERILPTKQCTLIHSPSLLANQEIVNLWPGQIPGRGRYNCIRPLMRCHCQPFCAHVSTQLEWICACTLLNKRNCLVKISFVFPVSVLEGFNSKNNNYRKKENYTEIPSHPNQNGYYQANKNQQILVSISGQRKTYTLLVEL
jgi:hypothetical protein